MDKQLILCMCMWCIAGCCSFYLDSGTVAKAKLPEKAWYLFCCGPAVWLLCLYVLLYDYFKGRN